MPGVGRGAAVEAHGCGLGGGVWRVGEGGGDRGGEGVGPGGVKCSGSGGARRGADGRARAPPRWRVCGRAAAYGFRLAASILLWRFQMEWFALLRALEQFGRTKASLACSQGSSFLARYRRPGSCYNPILVPHCANPPQQLFS